MPAHILCTCWAVLGLEGAPDVKNLQGYTATVSLPASVLSCKQAQPEHNHKCRESFQSTRTAFSQAEWRSRIQVRPSVQPQLI